MKGIGPDVLSGCGSGAFTPVDPIPLQHKFN